MKITGNYPDYTKEELLAECATRGIEGVDSNTLKADVVAALELSDEQNKESGTEEIRPNDQPPAPMESNIPHVGIPNVDNIPNAKDGDIPPQDADFTGGLFKMRPFVIRFDSEGNEKKEGTLHPGEVFALCIHPPNTYGRTHSLKNSLHYWEGSEGQFNQCFEKE